MNSKFLRFFAPMTIFSWVLIASPGLQAQPATTVDLLRQAYATLSMADHDYKGHRVEAMKQVESAARALRVNIRGDGKGHEKQGVSDEQLRVARGILERARAGLGGRALKHVNKAINQINIALSIR